jgi:GAF domain-containing protein/HAMP domain-containing protein
MTQMTSRRPKISFPLSAKLGLAFLIVFIVPTLIGGLLFYTTTQTIDQENISSFVQQSGQRQRQIIANTFVRAREDVASFAIDRDSNQLLVGLLLSDIQANPSLPEASETQVRGAISRTLLDPSTTLFQEARVLDRDGRLVAIAGDLLVGEFTLGQDESESFAYREITNLRENDSQVHETVVVSRVNEPIVEVIHTIRLRNTDNVIGYLVATMDIGTTLQPTLSFTDELFPAYSFLLSNNGVMVAPEDALDDAEASRDTEAVDLAFQEQTGFRFYRKEGGIGEEVGGYYARLVDTPFILVTQVNTADVLAQRREYLSVVLFPIIVGVVALATVLTLLARHLIAPLTNIQRAMQALSLGSFDTPVAAIERNDEIGSVARTFVDMREQTRHLIEDLERRVEQRTRDMETTHEISRTAVSQRNLQLLIDDAVDLIVERFQNIYHAQIFLIDQDRQYAVLRASTGTIGRELISRGHRLAIGSLSLIGQVTAQGEMITARDTAVSEVHRRNEFLPETRAELAIPLKIGDRVIGALDVQSRESATFDPTQVKVLQVMADQLVIAIENTRLYQESIQRLRTLENQKRSETRQAWMEYMYDNRTRQLTQQAGTPTDAEFEPLRRRAIDTNKPTVGETTDRNTVPIAIPIRLREEVIGAVVWELPEADYDPNKLQLAQDLTERLALSLDNTRLFEQSQRATERERLVNDISTKLTSQTDVNRILQTAVREVGQALRAPQVSIRLSRNNSIGSQPPSSDPDPVPVPDSENVSE